MMANLDDLTQEKKQQFQFLYESMVKNENHGHGATKNPQDENLNN